MQKVGIVVLTVVLIGIGFGFTDFKDKSVSAEDVYSPFSGTLRTSFIKQNFFGQKEPITRQEFLTHTRTFIKAFEDVAGESRVEVVIYEDVPSFTSFIGVEDDPSVQIARQMNERMKRTLSNLDDLPGDDFADIGYVRIKVSPVEEGVGVSPYAFGTIDFGRKLPSHIIFYAQSETVGRGVAERILPNGEIPEGFALGTGDDKNYNYYIPISIGAKMAETLED